MSDAGHSYIGPKPLPSWAQAVSYVGIPGLVVFYLLGMIPGTTSPFDRLSAQTAAQAAAVSDELKSNRQTQERIYRALRAICYRLPSSPSAPSCEQ